MQFSHIRYAAPTALLHRAEMFGAGRKPGGYVWGREKAGRLRLGPGESRAAVFGAGEGVRASLCGGSLDLRNLREGSVVSVTSVLSPGFAVGPCRRVSVGGANRANVFAFHLQFSSGEATLDLFNQQGVSLRRYKPNYNYR